MPPALPPTALLQLQTLVRRNEPPSASRVRFPRLWPVWARFAGVVGSPLEAQAPQPPRDNLGAG
jgi:hypothetical protein